jgi:glucuronokinase
MIIRERSYPRAGLIGNPSDGYHGKTISFLFRNFSAEVTLWETPELELQPTRRDLSHYESIRHLAEDVRQFGYYGGLRLLKATVRKFHDYCALNGIALHDRNFSLRYQSNIPRHVGMAGSSAIITACLRALCRFYGVDIPKPLMPNLILSVEKDELHISAGLQDRVIQTYEGMVYMDFNKEYTRQHGHGRYEPMDIGLLPPIYLAYDTTLSEGSEIFHNNIRERFNQGDPAVVQAMLFWADLAEQVKEMLLKGEGGKIGPLLNANFDRRRQIYRLLHRNIAMVEAARSVGASAKFTGSGGAIVGAYEDEEMYRRVEAVLKPMGVEVLKPVLR